MNQELLFMIDQLSREKGIDKEIMVDAMKAALLTAAKRRYGANADISSTIDLETGALELEQHQQVVEKVVATGREITLDEAKEIDPEAQIGDLITTPLEVEDFGRIAAQTAKQVIMQRVREAEREMVYAEYHDREGDLVHGVAQRYERGDLIVELGKAEAVVPRREQNFRETFRRGERLRAYVLEVRKESRGPQIILSRTTPALIEKLFDLEVPEISEGIVEIKGTVREPSGRSKIAVYSHDKDVDPVGACVGTRGSRVQAIVQELHGEKIDIVAWEKDEKSYVRNALAPAKPVKLNQNSEERIMEVVIPDDQLSLAIGKKGQNVRLAARLTNWKIELKGESEVAAAALGIAREALSGDASVPLEALTGVNPEFLPQLLEAGFDRVQPIRDASDEDLLSVPGMTDEYLPFLREQVKECLEARKAQQAELLAKAAAITGSELSPGVASLLETSQPAAAQQDEAEASAEVEEGAAEAEESVALEEAEQPETEDSTEEKAEEGAAVEESVALGEAEQPETEDTAEEKVEEGAEAETAPSPEAEPSEDDSESPVEDESTAPAPADELEEEAPELEEQPGEATDAETSETPGTS